eukprot:TRINITY_DN67692_c2_g1_i2.p1 TRINITY_DN67692_c2_g1~~TRINITY_DN67692_c2_g1_i2.p1  ORF type:complete len:399 (-),score=15.43 TRINITY_DN67692_c2_g1_i2:430-1626(-)
MGGPREAVSVGLLGYVSLIVSFTLMVSEVVVRTFVLILPIRLFTLCFGIILRILPFLKAKRSTERTKHHVCNTTVDIVEAAGYVVEEHVARCQDGFLLALHRITGEKRSHKHTTPTATTLHLLEDRSDTSQKPVVLMLHGFLMSSECWVAPLHGADHSLLVYSLVDSGYDVWLGNNRGNKYSNKHTEYKPSETRFWDFSLDELALFDVPTMINHICAITKEEKLAVIGFSQGSTQAFATFSLCKSVAEKVSLFIALAPCCKLKRFGKGLGEFLVSPLRFISPTPMHILFGRRAFLPVTLYWQQRLSSSWFAKAIEFCTSQLFGWSSSNIDEVDKPLVYDHLYSSSSVKMVIHWCQMLRANRFQMFSDNFTFPGYVPIGYPVHQLTVPTAVFYDWSEPV